MIGHFAATYSNVTLLYYTCVHVFQRDLSLCYLHLKFVMKRKSTVIEWGTRKEEQTLLVHSYYYIHSTPHWEELLDQGSNY